MAVKFTTMIKMDSNREWKDYTLQQIREGSVEESNQIATFKMEVSQKDTLEENVRLIDAIKDGLEKGGDECCLNKAIDSKLVFDGWLGDAFCYDNLESIYELSYEMEKSIKNILEEHNVEKCKVIFNLTTLNF